MYKKDSISPNDSTGLIPEPRRNEILYKIDQNNLRNIIQSIPVPDDTQNSDDTTTALLAYYRYVFLVVGDNLYKLETVPELEILKTVPGYRDTKLIAGADGQHIFVIKDGKLIKLNFELETVPLPDDPNDPDGSRWEDAKLMDGSGQHLYIVRGDELIRMNAITNIEEGKDTGWTDATLLTAPGDSYVYLFRNGELIRMKEFPLEMDDKTGDWDGTTVLAGSGKSLYIVRDGELICLLGNTLQRDTNVEVGSGDNTTLMSFFINYVYLVKDFIEELD
ncbi:hypothetical protein [Paenibacillus agilis]|uniref:Uncharacterized protein n=1 Tax=Paenibacillus agilis TaxID=3020863 RepID=A0A559IZI6_9BACL|nr:hypothetical protein [Paenibacillus agilis]TVX93032.1 hypothetical protein FPZ44_08155 [Paenibacillus agilis]